MGRLTTNKVKTRIAKRSHMQRMNAVQCSPRAASILLPWTMRIFQAPFYCFLFKVVYINMQGSRRFFCSMTKCCKRTAWIPLATSFYLYKGLVGGPIHHLPLLLAHF